MDARRSTLGAEVRHRAAQDLGELLDRADARPLVVRVCSAAVHPNQDTRDACLGDEASVRPERLAAFYRGSLEHLLGPAADDRADLRIGRGLECSARHQSRECRAGSEKITERRPQFRLDVGGRLAGQEAPLDREGARGGDGCRIHSPGNGGHTHRPGREQGVCPTLGESPSESVEGGHDAGGVRDRIHSLLRHGAVRGDAGHVNAEPREAPVCDRDLQRAWLGDDGRVGSEPGEHLLGAVAPKFLVGHEGHDDIAPALRNGCGSHHQRREPTLHIERASTDQAVAIDRSGERVTRPCGDPDRIEVAAQHQRATAARAPRDRHD